MLFGLGNNLNENAIMEIDELAIPQHLAESFEGIVAYGQAQAEKLYEEVININGEITTKLQQGVSTGKLAESCTEIIQEGVLGNFITKAKEMFKKLWEAVKAMFSKFMAWLDSKFKSDKEFIAKYKKTLLAKASQVSDMEYKGHDWKITEIPANVFTAVEETAKEILMIEFKPKQIEYKEKVPMTVPKKKDDDDIVDAEIVEAQVTPKADGSDREDRIKGGIKAMSKALGTGDLDDEEEIISEYRDKLYGGSTEAESMEGPNVSALIKIVEEFDNDKKNVEKIQKAADKMFNASIRALEKQEKEANKANKDTIDLSLSTSIAVAKAQASLANRICATQVTALKARRDESRAILAKVVAYKKAN